MRSPRLVDHVSKNANSYNLLRLLAALSVVISHSFLVTGGESVAEPLEHSTGYPLGAHAVHLFFFLSGLMVSASFERSSSLTSFIMGRFLRIYPGLVAVTLFVMVFSGLLITTAPASSYWNIDSLGLYFVKNMYLAGAGAILPGVFETNAVPNEINAPLWTLKHEVICYALLAIVLTLAHRLLPKTGRERTLLGLCLLLTVAVAFINMNPPSYNDNSLLSHLSRFGFAFILGVTAWYARSLLPLSGGMAGLLFAGSAALVYFDLPFAMVSQIAALGYAALWIGHYQFGAITRATNAQDYSYGVYILGFPVQQSVFFLFATTSVLHNTAIAVPITLALAALSWNLIEHPAIMARSRLRRMRSVRV